MVVCEATPPGVFVIAAAEVAALARVVIESSALFGNVVLVVELVSVAVLELLFCASRSPSIRPNRFKISNRVRSCLFYNIY